MHLVQHAHMHVEGGYLYMRPLWYHMHRGEVVHARKQCQLTPKVAQYSVKAVQEYTPASHDISFSVTAE